MKLSKFTTDELCEIYHDLNGLRWNDKLGEKPKNFDKLPKYNSIKHPFGKTKYKYTSPIRLLISNSVSEYDLDEWKWVHIRGKTKEDFREWRIRHNDYYTSCIITPSKSQLIITTILAILSAITGITALCVTLMKLCQ